MQEAIKRMQPDWENIGLANDFLFGKVMKDPKLCLEMLRRALPELDIERIEYVESQKKH